MGDIAANLRHAFGSVVDFPTHEESPVTIATDNGPIVTENGERLLQVTKSSPESGETLPRVTRASPWQQEDAATQDDLQLGEVNISGTPPI